MKNPEKIEATYNNLLGNLSSCVPDGITKIDLNFLESESLINNIENNQSKAPASPKENNSLQFHIMESEDKVTLFNNEYVVWILPTNVNSQTSTLVLIGQYYEKNNNEETPKISLCFSTTGMYNTSKIILKIVEHFIKKVSATDKEISCLQYSN